MVKIILADNQDITRAGMMYVFSKMEHIECLLATNKMELIEQLKTNPTSIVIVDYPLFDFASANDIRILGLRFPESFFILWSEDLGVSFVKEVMNMSYRISVLLKEAKLTEIEQCISYAKEGRRFLCQHITEMLLEPDSSLSFERFKLTKTETEILIDIALGMTTKEIAEKRFSSFHTVNTHRKNIFRKLSVNNANEATRYALRSGLINPAEYSI